MRLPSLADLLRRPPDRLPVHLHVGAHKTGTTSIQDALAANRAMLAEQGILYLSRENGRSHIQRALRGKYRSARSVTRALRSSVPHPTRLVLSEENIAGHLGGMRDTGALYPEIEKRIARLHRRVLNGAPVTVFFCIRSFDSFLPAVWCEIIRKHPFQSFDAFLSAVDIDRLSWTTVIRAIVNAVGEENLALWDFDQFVAAPVRFAGLIAGVDPGLLDMPDMVQRPSVSAPAVEQLMALRASMSDVEIARHVSDVELRFPRPQHPRFAPFDRDMTSALRAKFIEDQASIRAAFPGVRIAGWQAPGHAMDPAGRRAG